MNSLFLRFVVVVLPAATLFFGCGREPTTLAPGSHEARGTIELRSFPSFRSGRLLYVYLPNGYWQSSSSYPMCLFLDGEKVFGADGSLQANHALDSLIAGAIIPPMIVVGVSAGTSTLRQFEYTPYDEWGDTNSGGGVQFLVALQDTLLPLLAQTYRIDRSRRSGLIGYSLGGLMAIYAAFSHDRAFGFVGGMSPTYGAGGGAIFQTIREHGRGEVNRLYQDTGTIQDNSGVVLDNVAALLDSVGFDSSTARTVHDYGGTHTVESWSRRLPGLLQFLFGNR